MKAALEKMMFDNVGTIHFIGIGGIGMSGIAEILHNLGYQIQGSDIGENDNVLRLRNLGIKVIVGHQKENIDTVSVVVKSTAVKEDNPEIIAAREKRIPVVKRSEMLAELMRLKISIAVSGAHGKTTTTAFIAAMFENAELNPTVINGGIINTRGTNAYLGSGDYLIAEADESDGTFIRIPATIAVITNIDAEHLDYYKNFANLKEAYKSFIHNIPFYGFGVVCKDHHEVANLIQNVQDREIITYGIDSESLDIKAININENIDGTIFDVQVSSRINGEELIIQAIKLPVAGRHNILNALAAISIGVKMKFNNESIVKAFSNFTGVKRRFTKTGQVNGITIIDDYAHHPEEIKATLRTAKQVTKLNINSKVIAIVQPHRYSRLENLFSEFVHCFDDADIVYIADIYSAGEHPIDGMNKEVLISSLRQNYKDKQINAFDSVEAFATTLGNIATKGDIVVFMGAGTITKWAYELPNILERNDQK
jgi:UDP-N-acetylmuramate--alanine ligase